MKFQGYVNIREWLGGYGEGGNRNQIKTYMYVHMYVCMYIYIYMYVLYMLLRQTAVCWSIAS